MISNLQAAPLFNNSSSVNAKYSHHETFHDMCYQENEVWLLTWLELFSPITPCVCVCVCVCASDQLWDHACSNKTCFHHGCHHCICHTFMER